MLKRVFTITLAVYLALLLNFLLPGHSHVHAPCGGIEADASITSHISDSEPGIPDICPLCSLHSQLHTPGYNGLSTYLPAVDKIELLSTCSIIPNRNLSSSLERAPPVAAPNS